MIIKNGILKSISSNDIQKHTFDIPEEVKVIGRGVFEECMNLNSINIPATVKIISSYAMSSCKTLKDVTLTEGIEYIGNGVFSECSNIESIFIPKSAIYIGNNIFSNCNKLSKVAYAGKIHYVKCIDGFCLELNESYNKDGYTIWRSNYFPDQNHKCFVATNGDIYVHGVTEDGAKRELMFRLEQDTSIAQYNEFKANSIVDFYKFYRIMADVNDSYLENFCKQIGININGQYKVKDIVKMSKGHSGYDTLVCNLQEHNIISMAI